MMEYFDDDVIAFQECNLLHGKLEEYMRKHAEAPGPTAGSCSRETWGREGGRWSRARTSTASNRPPHRATWACDLVPRVPQARLKGPSDKALPGPPYPGPSRSQGIGFHRAR